MGMSISMSMSMSMSYKVQRSKSLYGLPGLAGPRKWKGNGSGSGIGIGTGSEHCIVSQHTQDSYLTHTC